MLSGFGVGGALALYSGFTHSKDLAGLIALSAWLPFKFQFPEYAKGNSNTPVLQVHTNEDVVVPFRNAEICNFMISGYAKNTQFLKLEQMGHLVSDEYFDEMKDFADTNLPPL